MLGLVFLLMSPCITGVMTTDLFYKKSNEGLLYLPPKIPNKVVAVDLSYNKINYLRRTTFIEYQRCTHLDLHCNQIEEIEIGSLFSFIKIEVLRLDHNKLQYIKPEYFSGLQSLRTLTLGYNLITNISKGSFVLLTKLKSLFLSGSSLIKISSDMWKGLNSLEYLYVGHNKVRKIGHVAFKHIRNVKLIYLRSNFLKKIKKNMWIGLHNLEDLDLSSNEIISIDQDAFHGVGNLKWISLAYNKLLDFEGYAFSSINILAAVKLDGNPLLWSNFTQENNLEKRYQREIAKLEEVLERKVKKLQNEMKNLKATSNNQKGVHKVYNAYSGRVALVDLPGRPMMKFRGSAELGALASGVVFVLILVGPVATCLQAIIGRLFRSNLHQRDSTKRLQTLRGLSRAHVTTPQNLKEKYYKEQEIGNHCVEFRKGYLTYFGVRVQGAGGVLQSKASDVVLYISKGLHAFVYGYIHTDPGPFLEKIPEGHCLVAPIVEYHYDATNDVSNKELFFKIKIPHCVTLKEDFKLIRVQHGDIHDGVAFTQLPTLSSYFRVDEKYITIYTRHFSQFICTGCEEMCYGQARAFMFRRITPSKISQSKVDPAASLRLYICSPLHKIRDYREKLIEDESKQEVKRILYDHWPIEWDPDECTPDKAVNIEIHSLRWEPRLKMNQEWDASSRKILLRRKISRFHDILYCHTCKTNPSIIADFDFTLPEAVHSESANSTTVMDENPIFSGKLQIYASPDCFILDENVDIDPNDVWKRETNKEQTILRKITKKLISTDDDLMDFGLHLGFTYEMVIQKRTNNPRSVEGAAMALACHWWDHCTDAVDRKKRKLYKSCKELNKEHLRAEVDEVLKRIH